MYIKFINNKIKKLCEDYHFAQIKLGNSTAKKLFQRIAEIRAADNISVLKSIPGPRCHLLTNNRQGQFAVDLKHPKRLIFLPIYEGEMIEKQVKDVLIIDIVDYH